MDDRKRKRLFHAAKTPEQKARSKRERKPQVVVPPQMIPLQKDFVSYRFHLMAACPCTIQRVLFFVNNVEKNGQFHLECTEEDESKITRVMPVAGKGHEIFDEQIEIGTGCRVCVSFSGEKIEVGYVTVLLAADPSVCRKMIAESEVY